MRIAFTSFPYGGLDTYVLEAGRWLSKRGHTVHVAYLSSQVPPKHERYAQLNFHHVQPSVLPYYVDRLDILRTHAASIVKEYVNSRRMGALLKQIKANEGLDLTEIVEGFSFPRFFEGIPYMVKMHGAEWTFRHYCEDGHFPQALVHQQRRMLMAARQIFAISQSSAAFIAGACNIPPRLIEVIPYPADFRLFEQLPPPPQGPPFRLMTVGRLEQRKGTHTLVAALRKVWRQEPDTHLHLCGKDGNFGKAQIEAVIPPEEHQGRIHFEGFVDHERVIEHYYQTHLYITPTRYETFGFTILEAMCCGRPVIAADIGPVSELVRDGETGWLVQRDAEDALADTIILALRNPALRESYGRAARDLAIAKCDVDKVMSRQLTLYEKAIAS